MSRFESPRKLGDVIEDLIGRLGIRSELDEAGILARWAVLAGPEINEATESAWVRDRKLFVKITGAALRQQLHLNRSDWRRRLNEKIGEDRIEEILFR